ncbi:PQQ-binding-like beta-propeller repeat protein [Mycobacteroides salmoniphilum]|uniref:outer membrane protein assembly factor BamB family protein n=1 Tax=Mycobacteroides salmoniphilum TaxID=404941 RepID=UPI00099293D4|nr:PQQ-binding-like beta-propeller repeat protein [Mycobacteroides salmoniphilum]QCH23325.1 Outer membrane protein assembly factor BamB [Mycobacteroides salmoniphilum]
MAGKYRWIGSAVVGGAVAAGVVGIALAINALALRASVNGAPAPVEAAGVIALTASGVALIGVGARPIIRRLNLWSSAIVAINLIVVGLIIGAVWRLDGLFGEHVPLRFVDTEGVVVLSRAAVVVGFVALALAVFAMFPVDKTQRLAATGAFVVVALVVSMTSYVFVNRYRADVWYPSTTSQATSPAPLPATVGNLRYRVRLYVGVPPGYARTVSVASVGNGFMTYTEDGLAAYDGPTGRLRWRVAGFSGYRQAVLIPRDGGDAAGIVVLVRDGALIALDGGSGKVLWRRPYSGVAGDLVSGADSLGYKDGDGEFTSLDPASGSTRWSKQISCRGGSAPQSVSGQFLCDGDRETTLIVDAYRGNTIAEVAYGESAASPGGDVYVIVHYNRERPLGVDGVSIVDSRGLTVDEIPGARPISPARQGYLLLAGGDGMPFWRNYRARQSSPAKFSKVQFPAHFNTTWVGDQLLIGVPEKGSPLRVLDPGRPAAEPIDMASPCMDSTYQIQAVPGAVVVSCNGYDSGSEIVGFVE